jgi:hypothetical protein
MTQLQTIYYFRDLPLAELAKTKLESEGIPCFLANKNHIAMNWLASFALGGVKLQVRIEDAPIAKEILSKDLSENLNDLEEQFPALEQSDHCQKCNSTNISPFKSSRKAGALSLLLGLPLIFFRKSYKCHDCGHIMKVNT